MQGGDYRMCLWYDDTVTACPLYIV